MKRKEKTLDGRLLQRHLSNFIIHSKVKNKHTLSVSNDILIFFIIHIKKKDYHLHKSGQMLFD
jgi:hypothetical protein